MLSKLVLSFLLCLSLGGVKSYDPTWDSLDSRPLPQWYDDAKIGIFMHWGVYSVPPYGSEWFWKFWHDGSGGYVNYMTANYPPNFTYQDFASGFTTEFFDPKQWADLFVKAGAKYVVLTSKHHDGFMLWPSKYSGLGWNAKMVGPNRDLIGELAKAITSRSKLRFGLYHSLLEWFHPLYMEDQQNSYNTTDFVDAKIQPELYELISTYKPEVLWSDGEWEAPSTYWKSTKFLAWLYNESPVKDTIVVNDRWGSETMCHHGDFYTCSDAYNPGVLQPHKWENAFSIDKGSWGNRRVAVLSDYLTAKDLIYQIVTTISCGGNTLINIGPSKEGLIDPIFQDRLTQMGGWLGINGEAIYQSRPWSVQNDSLASNQVWYTYRPDLNAVYANVLQWPEKSILNLQHFNDIYNDNTQIQLLDSGTSLSWKVSNDRVLIEFPDKAVVSSDLAWTLKIFGYN